MGVGGDSALFAGEEAEAKPLTFLPPPPPVAPPFFPPAAAAASASPFIREMGLKLKFLRGLYIKCMHHLHFADVAAHRDRESAL